jgi:hypothetical protein
MGFFVYLDVATPNIIAIGDTIRSNSSIGAGAVNGGGLFHAIQTPDGQLWNVQVQNNGVVTAVNTCP